jgi:hypothetical protein
VEAGSGAGYSREEDDIGKIGWCIDQRRWVTARQFFFFIVRIRV